MQKFNVKNLIFASSSSVYGNYEKTPFNENYADLVPISPDAQTKLECEKIIKTYTDKYNLSAVCLRFFTVYGRRQRPDLAIAKFINAIINDKTIQIYGDGLTYRDYTHIDDIVSGIISSLLYVERERKNIFEIINIGSGSPIKLIDMVNMIEAALNKKAKTEYLPLQLGDVNITYADINKAKRLLNYEPKISFEYGLNSFVKEFLKTGIQEY